MAPRTFNVGPFVYTTRLIKGWVKHKGQLCAALCDFRSQQLLVSDELPPEQRIHAVLHELRHAYRHHFPVETQNEENDCDFFGNMALQLIKDLFGGDALKSIAAEPSEAQPTGDLDWPPPETEIQIGDDLVARERETSTIPFWGTCVAPHRAFASAERVACGKCGKTFAGGLVVNSTAKWDPMVQGFVIHRRLYCDGCHHVQEWHQGSNADGHIAGDPINEPRYIIGDRVTKFLYEHPGFLVQE